MTRGVRVAIGDWLRARPQHLLPGGLLTAVAGRLSKSRAGWIRRPLIAGFRRLYNVNVAEADLPAGGAESFDAFFTRGLRPGARPLAGHPGEPVCPCDGTVSQAGELEADRLIQAKGHDYSAGELLGDEELARPFSSGRFVTVYLAPADYHRVHMPIAGRLLTEVRVPGTLFSVSAATTRVIDRLFCRNERMAAVFDTAYGPVAVVMVAAMLVAGIETSWDSGGDTRPDPETRRRDFPQPLQLDRGAELGRFHWGSTVIVLTTGAFPHLSSALVPGARVRMGQALGQTDQEAGGTRNPVS